MPLFMIAAKDIKQAFDILSIKPGKATQNHFVEEPERIGSFLYDFKEAFLNYESYYQFDPYRETYLEKSRVPEIKIFQTPLKADGGTCNRRKYMDSKIYLVFEKIRRFAVG